VKLDAGYTLYLHHDNFITTKAPSNGAQKIADSITEGICKRQFMIFSSPSQSEEIEMILNNVIADQQYNTIQLYISTVLIISTA